MRRLVLLFFAAPVFASGPYDQTYTFNQQYGSTNWYSSPLGMGVAQAGVTLIGGLVNVLSRPDPVQVPQQQPVQIQGNVPNYGYGYCQLKTVYTQTGEPVAVRVCP